MTQPKSLTLGSLFDGIGGFPLAGLYAGIQPVWASEIEPFPIRVTTKRLPNMQHHGDIHDLKGSELPPVDIITFGSPCQDLSIAGKRSGLEGERSGLFFQAVRIIQEMREKTNGQKPRWAVWENVPGALSSCKGRDFNEVLQSLVAIKNPDADVPMPEANRWLPAGEIMGDDYSLAWRILDAAKGWGVAQRRRRIFVVLDLDGRRAGQILFESEGVSGYTPPGKESRQGTAQKAETGTDSPGQGKSIAFEPGAMSRMGGHVWDDQMCTLRAQMGDNQAAVAVEFNPTDSRIKVKDDGICQTLCRRAGTGGNQVPLLLKQREGCAGGGKGPLIQCNKSATLSCHNDQTLFQPQAYGICSDKSNSMLSPNPHSGIYEADTSRTLDCNGGNPSCSQGGISVVEPKKAELASGKEQVGTLTQGAMKGFSGNQEIFSGDYHILEPDTAQSYALQGNMIGRKDENGPRGDGINAEICYTLNTIDRPAVAEAGEGSDYLVRRLTPGECCRLQGFPDGWCENLESKNPSEDEIRKWQAIHDNWNCTSGKTNKPKTAKQIIKWLATPATDGALYKAFGNSVAVPCVFFVLAGIMWAYEMEE